MEVLLEMGPDGPNRQKTPAIRDIRTCFPTANYTKTNRNQSEGDQSWCHMHHVERVNFYSYPPLPRYAFIVKKIGKANTTRTLTILRIHV